MPPPLALSASARFESREKAPRQRGHTVFFSHGGKHVHKSGNGLSYTGAGSAADVSIAVLIAEGDKVPAHGGEPQKGGAVCPHGHGFLCNRFDGFGRGEGVHRV